MDGSAGSMLTRDQIDDLIRKLYGRPKKRGDVLALGQRIGMTTMQINSRARAIKAYNFRARGETAWSAQELTIVEQYAGHSAAAIQRKLRAAGFTRSKGAIHRRRHLMGLSVSEERRASAMFSVPEIAEALGVSDTVVFRWIDRGSLAAQSSKSGEKRERRRHIVTPAALRQCLALHHEQINLKIAPQARFFSVLLGDCA